jgi:hypothetical protein
VLKGNPVFKGNPATRALQDHKGDPVFKGNPVLKALQDHKGDPVFKGNVVLKALKEYPVLKVNVGIKALKVNVGIKVLQVKLPRDNHQWILLFYKESTIRQYGTVQE